jgi:hypothetical protein
MTSTTDSGHHKQIKSKILNIIKWILLTGRADNSGLPSFFPANLYLRKIWQNYKSKIRKRRDKLMSASVTMPKVYKEIVDFLAAGTTSQGFISFQLSDKAQERVANLI